MGEIELVDEELAENSKVSTDDTRNFLEDSKEYDKWFTVNSEDEAEALASSDTLVSEEETIVSKEQTVVEETRGMPLLGFAVTGIVFLLVLGGVIIRLRYGGKLNG